MFALALNWLAAPSRRGFIFNPQSADVEPPAKLIRQRLIARFVPRLSQRKSAEIGQSDYGPVGKV
jgi:hypothetical protein